MRNPTDDALAGTGNDSARSGLGEESRQSALLLIGFPQSEAPHAIAFPPATTLGRAGARHSSRCSHWLNVNLLGTRSIPVTALGSTTANHLAPSSLCRSSPRPHAPRSQISLYLHLGSESEIEIMARRLCDVWYGQIVAKSLRWDIPTDHWR